MAKKRQKKHLEIKQSTKSTRVYLGFIRQKQAQCVFRPVAGLVGSVFYLFVVYACFWPKTDKVYLFLAAARNKTLGADMMGEQTFQGLACREKRTNGRGGGHFRRGTYSRHAVFLILGCSRRIWLRYERFL